MSEDIEGNCDECCCCCGGGGAALLCEDAISSACLAKASKDHLESQKIHQFKLQIRSWGRE